MCTVIEEQVMGADYAATTRSDSELALASGSDPGTMTRRQ
jgi:hypothetical protein